MVVSTAEDLTVYPLNRGMVKDPYDTNPRTCHFFKISALPVCKRFIGVASRVTYIR